VTTIRFTIPGRVSGKGRPKFASRGKFVHVYTPSKTVSMEAVVRDFGSKAMDGLAPLDGPIGLIIKITQTPAPSWSKKKRAAAFWVTGKPDVDNICKLIGDSLNNIVWQDDAQIASLHVERHYSVSEQERVEIVVDTLGHALGV
jgi:Holliday junction resolvase RusA-like endonuclease